MRTQAHAEHSKRLLKHVSKAKYIYTKKPFKVHLSYIDNLTLITNSK